MGQRNPSGIHHRRWCYELRVAVDRAVLLVVVLSWATWTAVLVWRGRHGPLTATFVLGGMELVLPLLGAAITAVVAARDWEEGTIPWRLSLPGGAPRLLAVRLVTAGLVWVVAVVAWAATAAVAWRPAGRAAVTPAGIRWEASDVLVLLTPPALWLAALSLAGTLLGRASLWGITAASAFWLADLASRGTLVEPLGVLYLSAGPVALDYAANRRWLVGGAVAVAVLTYLGFRKEERWLR
ncbi:MAG TPA: hypothetical protein VIL38_07200 [Thermaerobacter sp.]